MATAIHDVSVTTVYACLWQLKSVAIVGTTVPTNWTVVSSGTGTGGTWVASGDVISTASVLANDRAWFVLQGHGYMDGGVTYRRQLCFQCDASGSLRVKVSPRAGFVDVSGAGPGIVPAASDQRILLGGGTDASPTFETLFPSSASWLQGQFNEGDDFFYLYTYHVGGGLPTSMLLLGLTPMLYDSTGGLYDKDPAVYYARTGAACALASSWASEQYGPLGLLAFLSAGGTSDAWVRLPASVRESYDTLGAFQGVIPGGLPQSPSFPSSPVYAQETLRFGRRLALAGVTTGAHEAGNLNTCGDKGEERYARYTGRRFAVPTVLDAVSPSTGLTSTGTLVGVGDLVLPWTLGTPIRDGA